MPHFTAKKALPTVLTPCGEDLGEPSTAATVGSRLSPHQLHPRNLLDLHKRDVEHLINGLHATEGISVVC